jgi:hypothetical protein
MVSGGACLVAGLPPDAVVGAAGLVAVQGGDGAGAVEGPVHAGGFEALADDRHDRNGHYATMPGSCRGTSATRADAIPRTPRQAQDPKRLVRPDQVGRMPWALGICVVWAAARAFLL